MMLTILIFLAVVGVVDVSVIIFVVGGGVILSRERIWHVREV